MQAPPPVFALLSFGSLSCYHGSVRCLLLRGRGSPALKGGCICPCAGQSDTCERQLQLRLPLGSQGWGVTQGGPGCCSRHTWQKAPPRRLSTPRAGAPCQQRPGQCVPGGVAGSQGSSLRGKLGRGVSHSIPGHGRPLSVTWRKGRRQLRKDRSELTVVVHPHPPTSRARRRRVEVAQDKSTPKSAPRVPESSEQGY